jgi:hypothetical protein
MVFRQPRAGAERRGSVVAGAGVDAVENDHGFLATTAGSS